jgi:hypothetical protein
MTETFLDATPFGPGALRGECPINTGYECPINTGYECPINTGYECPINTGYECPINTGYETAFGMFLFRTSVL